MTASTEVRQRLTGLQARLDAVNRAWTVDNYDSLFGFYVESLPTESDLPASTVALMSRSLLVFFLAAGLMGALFGSLEAQLQLGRVQQLILGTAALAVLVAAWFLAL